MTLSNSVYDKLKWIAQYLLPGLGTLYFALAKIWGFPYGEEVVGTISAIDIFIGTILGISSANYEGDGNITFGSEEDSVLEIDEEAMKPGGVIMLKVKGS